ncbi:hypothetical protein WN55_08095 [Dufourea novaeangliae]|uniref:Uncharacterized protein n=1 Tax=Dufourea novaeangliae TaxID=178035 RepID=A0A154P7G2_DUFNO|nr:hypothetical protein WN55_08095 [Dufourea novaeangliae]
MTPRPATNGRTKEESLRAWAANWLRNEFVPRNVKEVKGQRPRRELNERQKWRERRRTSESLIRSC